MPHRPHQRGHADPVFGGAINLNVYSHMLVLDGVYVERSDGSLRFR